MGNMCCAPKDMKHTQMPSLKTRGSKKSIQKKSEARVLEAQMDMYKEGSLHLQKRRPTNQGDNNQQVVSMPTPPSARGSMPRMNSGLQNHHDVSIREHSGRQNSVLHGQYTTEQSFSEAPLDASDLQSDRFHSTNLRFPSKNRKTSEFKEDNESQCEIERVEKFKDELGQQDIPPAQTPNRATPDIILATMENDKLSDLDQRDGDHMRNSAVDNMLHSIDERMSREEQSHWMSTTRRDNFNSKIDQNPSLYSKQQQLRDSQTTKSYMQSNQLNVEERASLYERPNEKLTSPETDCDRSMKIQNKKLTQFESYRDLISLVEEKLLERSCRADTARENAQQDNQFQDLAEQINDEQEIHRSFIEAQMSARKSQGEVEQNADQNEAPSTFSSSDSSLTEDVDIERSPVDDLEEEKNATSEMEFEAKEVKTPTPVQKKLAQPTKFGMKFPAATLTPNKSMKPFVPKLNLAATTPALGLGNLRTPQKAPQTPVSNKRMSAMLLQKQQTSQAFPSKLPTIRRGSTFSDNPASPASTQLSVANEISSFKFKATEEEDAIDQMLDTYLRSHQVKVPIQRIDHSRYLFGTKLIIATIQNGKLMVRVGGGFMTVDELVSQHSQKEIFKLRSAVAKEKKKIAKIMCELTEKHRQQKKQFAQ